MASCTFGIDTDGLSGDGGPTEDATLLDGGRTAESDAHGTTSGKSSTSTGSATHSARTSTAPSGTSTETQHTTATSTESATHTGTGSTSTSSHSRTSSVTTSSTEESSRMDAGTSSSMPMGTSSTTQTSTEMSSATQTSTQTSSTTQTSTQMTSSTATDAGMNSSMATDAGIDSGIDTGVDSGIDSGIDTGVDAGIDSGLGCPFALVQAVPGTSQYQVIEQQPMISWTLDPTLSQPGDLLVVIAYGGQGGDGPTTAPNMTFSVSDTAGNTYYAGDLYTNTNESEAAIQIFYAPNIVGGVNTVTVQSAATGLQVWTSAFVQEYSGIALSDVVEVSTGQMAPSYTEDVTPGAMTTVNACDLVVAAFTDGNVSEQNLSSGPDLTIESSDDWDPGAAGDNVGAGVVGGSVVDPEFVLSLAADNGWVAAQMAFRIASTSPLPQPSQIAFTTAPQTVAADVCSGPVTVASQLASSLGVTDTRTATGLDLALSATTADFFIDPACAFPISTVVIGAGTDSSTFYFLSSSAGTPTVTLTGPPGIEDVSQTETVN